MFERLTPPTLVGYSAVHGTSPETRDTLRSACHRPQRPKSAEIFSETHSTLTAVMEPVRENTL